MSDIVKNYVDNIDNALNSALSNAQMLQNYIQETEGDSDLYRKLAFYLTPNLNHWVTGAQAGNIKDLNETLARRLAEKGTNMQPTAHQGDGHEVLTKPSA